MTLRIISEQFFSNYIFHPCAKDLSLKDQRKALINSIFFAIFTLGVCHFVCLIKYHNRTFKFVVLDDPTTKKGQIVVDSHITDFKKANQQKFQLIDTGSLEQETSKDLEITKKKAQSVIEPHITDFKKGDQQKFQPTDAVSLEQETSKDLDITKFAKDVSNSEEDILETLTKSANKEGDAFLIDFSKVNPSNIFKIFNKGYSPSKEYGDVEISDKISYDESHKFVHNFPFKYKISILSLEINERGYSTSSTYTFTMNDEGKVESYGKVFDNFNDYIEHRMNSVHHKVKLTFQHFNFYSSLTDGKYKTLRKKSPTKTNWKA